MRIKVLRCGLPLLLISLLIAANSSAIEIRGRSSTQFQWFNDYYNGRQVELAQYLRLTVTNIDQAGKFSFYGYGRGGALLSGNEGMNGDGANGRLYYLYVDYRDIGGKADVKLGRQFSYLSAGTALIDGVQLDLKDVGPFGFTFLGGRDVVFGMNGEMGHTGNYAMGMSMYMQELKNTDLEISWFRKYDQYDVARDMLGASFKQYLFNTVKLYSNGQFDMISETFTDFLGGIKIIPIADLALTGEWYQNYPTFDATSIYSVFAVNRYKEGLVRADYTLNEHVDIYAGYKRQDFGDEDGWGDVYTVGVTLRPIDTLTIAIDYDRRTGYGGSLNGGTIDVDFAATPQLHLAAGLVYDVYQRDSMTGQETAKNVWLGARYKLTKSMSAALRVEENINKTYDSNTQGRFVFDYDF